MHRIFSTLTAITKISELCLVAKIQQGGQEAGEGVVRRCTLKYLFLHSMFIHKYSVPCFLYSFIMCRMVWEYTERCFIKSHLVIYWYAYNTVLVLKYCWYSIQNYKRTFRKMVWNMKWGLFLLKYDFFSRETVQKLSLHFK